MSHLPTTLLTVLHSCGAKLAAGRNIWTAYIRSLASSTIGLDESVRASTMCMSARAFVRELRADGIISSAEADAILRRIPVVDPPKPADAAAAPPKPAPKAAVKPAPKAAPKPTAVSAAAPRCTTCGAKDHTSSTRHCSLCGKIGHDRRGCPKWDLKHCTTCGEAGHDSSERHCGICRKTGHDKRTCTYTVIVIDDE